METRSGLVSYLLVMVEHQEGEHNCRGPLEGERGPIPTQGLLSLGFQSQEEEFPQNLTIKLSGECGCLGEREET